MKKTSLLIVNLLLVLQSFGQSPGGVTGLQLWLKADNGVIKTGNNISSWQDQSGNSRHFNGNNNPQFVTNGFNFNPSISFNGSNQYFNRVGFAGSFLQGEIFYAIKSNKPKTQDNGFCTFGTGLNNHFTWSNQNIYDGFGTNSRKNFVPDWDIQELNVYNTMSKANKWTAWRNGVQKHTTASNSVAWSTNPNIGWGNYNYFSGEIPEVILFNKELTASEKQRVNTYIGIKYGITFAQNYLAANGTVIWDATSNSSYSNNITGIGRDNASALYQKQSKSINAGSNVIIGKGNALTSSNTLNSNTFTDQQFLIVGDNGLSKSLITALTYSAPGGDVNKQFAAIWKVQNTGTVGQVTIAWAAGIDNLHLVRSTDATFDGSDEFIPMTNLVIINGNAYNTATITLNNGDFFTFAGYLDGPGGVTTNLAFWYKPESGITTTSDKVSSWVDQKSDLEITPTVSTNGPSYYSTGSNAINFNPTLGFSAATTDDDLRKATSFPALTTGASIFSVIQPNDASNRWYFHWGVAGAGYYGNYGACSANNPGVYTNSHGGYVNCPTTMGPITTPSMVASRWSTTAGANQWQLRKNGMLHSGTTSSASLNVPANTAVEIGSVNNRTAEYAGNISEVIGFTSRLSDADNQKVQSYLAIKYGITYMNDANTTANNYVNSTGAVVWDATANASFNNNIAGIARDAVGGINQKQSKSINLGQQLLIGNGTSLADNNLLNPNSMSNGQYLIWGDNGQSKTLSVPLIYAAPGGDVNNRFGAIWKVQNTNSVGQVTVAWNSGIDNLHLVRSTDATFDGSDEFVSMSGTIQVNGTTYNTATITLNNGDYISFAGFIEGPGGVVANLAFWYKPESGISTTAGKVSSWVDQKNDIEITPAVPTNGPTINYTGANSINFNPSLYFNNLTREDALRKSSGLPALTTGASSFSVIMPSDASSRWYFHWGVAGAGYYTNYGACSANNISVYTNSHGGYVNCPTTMSSITTPSMISSRWNSTAGTNQWQLRKNGVLHSGTTSSTLLNVPANTALEIGDANNRTQPNEYVGNISEVIGYTARLSDSDNQKVQSYLSLKYGITYMNDANTNANNYVNSSGSVVWDATANASYNNNIAGIARDLNGGLHQKQSKSINSDKQIIIGTVGVAETNIDNTTGLSNNQFLIWGDNGLAKVLSTALLNGAAPGGEVNYRFGAIWKTQNTGSVGTVRVLWPEGISNMHIVQSTDAIFDNTDVFTAMDNSLTLGGINYKYADVTLTNGGYFTIAGFAVAPGGVLSGLQLWFDAGVNANLTTWQDRMNDFTISKQGAQSCSIASGDKASNFNPHYVFPNTGESHFSGQLTGSLAPSALGRLQTSFAVGSKSANIDGTYNHITRFGSGPGNAVTHRFGLGMNGLNHQATVHYIDNGGTVERRHTTNLSLNQMNIISGQVSSTVSGSNKQTGLNGNYQTFSDAITADVHPYFQIGGSTYGFAGKIPEVAYYNTSLSLAERRKVDSYFAIKYGITLGFDYMSSSDVIVWNTTANSAYNNNIAGLARDNASGLHQKQSNSVNSGRQVLISTDGLANTNSDNFTLLDNNQFLIWGDNGLSTNFNVAIAGNSDINYRMNRIWKVQETGAIGTVTIAWPIWATNLTLVTNASDPTFSAGNTYTAYTRTQFMVNGVPYYKVTIDLANNSYFTFAAYNSYPGGVSNNLSFWTKGDVNQGSGPWIDNSINGNDIEAIGSMNISDGSVQHNFNPYYSGFSATDYFKDDACSFAPAGVYTQQSLSCFTAVTPNSSTTKGKITGIDNDNNYAGEPGFSLSPSGKPHFYKYSGTTNSLDHANSVPVNQAALLNFIANDATKLMSVGLNNNYTSTTWAGNTFGTWGSYLQIGNGTWDGNGDGPFAGDIMEVIWYNRALNTSEQLRVNSYLATKYGVTLDQTSPTDYIASNGSTITWNATTNSGYNNEIFGIGRDDLSGLLQIQSKSFRTTDVLTVYLGSTKHNSQMNNPSSFTSGNMSFLMIGNDGQNVLNSIYPNPELPPLVDSRLKREWKVQLTNYSNDDLTLEFDLTSTSLGTLDPAHLVLMIDDDADFTTGASLYGTATPSTVGINVIGTIITITGIKASWFSGTPYFTLGSLSTNSSLPVELISLTANCTEENQVEINWTTASENNSAYFEVKKSRDGMNWIVLDSVIAAGNSSSELNYSMTDSEIIETNNYYKLTQIDFDGTQKTYPIISVNCSKKSNLSMLEIFPNPSEGEFWFKFNSQYDNCTANLIIRNTEGKVIYVQPIELQKGISNYQMEKLDLFSGMYYINLENEHFNSEVVKHVVK